MSGERQRVKKMCTGARGAWVRNPPLPLRGGLLKLSKAQFLHLQTKANNRKKILIVSIEIIDL